MFLFAGSKLFKYINMYSPDKEFVEGVTFTNNEKYLKAVSGIDIKMKGE
jgi:hypothetical protein